jgi:tetratricopeptide (TPR) repeat protein
MTIVSTTLTGSNADIIGDALASVVNRVDRCIVIDTGAKDDTLAVAREVAGPKLLVREFPWRNDFAAARNFALHAAEVAGARWAVTVDTDERLVFDPGFDLKKELAASRSRVLLVAYANGTYSKERIIRLPAKVRWSGPTHEVLSGQRPGESQVLPGIRFTELGKSPEQAQAKFERDVAVLRDYTQSHPQDPRWFYYLGASLHDLQRHEEAIEAYRRCADLRGWNEEGAWACFRMANCYCALERWQDAIDACARGLGLRPATAELAWLAGFASYKLKRYEDAIAWSNMAVVNGFYDGAGASFNRISFRDPTGLYEGPYDVLRWTFKETGNEEAAQAAAEEWAAAKAARSGAPKPEPEA